MSQFSSCSIVFTQEKVSSLKRDKNSFQIECALTWYSFLKLIMFSISEYVSKLCYLQLQCGPVAMSTVLNNVNWPYKRADLTSSISDSDMVQPKIDLTAEKTLHSYTLYAPRTVLEALGRYFFHNHLGTVAFWPIIIPREQLWILSSLPAVVLLCLEAVKNVDYRAWILLNKIETTNNFYQREMSNIHGLLFSMILVYYLAWYCDYSAWYYDYSAWYCDYSARYCGMQDNLYVQSIIKRPQGQNPPMMLSQVSSQYGAIPIPALHISSTRDMSLAASISNKPQFPVFDVSTHSSHSSGHTNIAER